MPSEGYGSCCVSVCLSVKSHITLETSLWPEKAVMYSGGDKGQKICDIFSETAPLQRSIPLSHHGHTSGGPFFLQRTHMRIVHTQVLEHNVMLPTQLPTQLL